VWVDLYLFSKAENKKNVSLLEISVTSTPRYDLTPVSMTGIKLEYLVRRHKPLPYW